MATGAISKMRSSTIICAAAWCSCTSFSSSMRSAKNALALPSATICMPCLWSSTWTRVAITPSLRILSRSQSSVTLPLSAAKV
ncbi:hypothetical protein D3C75_1039040 [compost metagenome]